MIDIIVDDEVDDSFILPESIEQAVQMACQAAGFPAVDAELCIRFAPDQELQLLNKQWRDRDRVTDVLSFPMQQSPDYEFSQSLGDIALAYPFIALEAKRLGLPLQDHALHLIVHSTLHLLGYDHMDDADAEQMQKLEQQAMALLDLHDPYLNDDIDETVAQI